MSLNPTVLDASTINHAGEFEMFLFDDEQWENSPTHHQQLMEKVAVYVEASSSRSEAKNREVRITIVTMYEPDQAGREFLSLVRSAVEKEGINFSCKFHEPVGVKLFRTNNQ